MMKPEQFRQVADEALGGLVAGPALFNRALSEAAAGSERAAKPLMRRGLAMAMSLALLLGVFALTLPRPREDAVPVVGTLAAGEANESVMKRTADLPRGSLVLTREARPAGRGVWERGDGANFPLLRVDGRYYRMLTNPTEATALRGAELGRVSEFSGEPALSGGSGILSNTAGMDSAVYSVPGMDGAAVAAEVNGKTRLFQRVSFAGSALLGGESLRDTIPGGAIALQLSDAGTVSDPDRVAQLMDILYSQAAYLDSAGKAGSQTLLIQYANGAVLQMGVSGDSLSACGTWACPAFLEALRGAAE